jgi:hypothetical protein
MKIFNFFNDFFFESLFGIEMKNFVFYTNSIVVIKLYNFVKKKANFFKLNFYLF